MAPTAPNRFPLDEAANDIHNVLNFEVDLSGDVWLPPSSCLPDYVGHSNNRARFSASFFASAKRVSMFERFTPNPEEYFCAIGTVS